MTPSIPGERGATPKIGRRTTKSGGDERRSDARRTGGVPRPLAARKL